MGRKARNGAYDATSVDVGNRIRTRRHGRGLTLKELGGECGLSHPFLSQVERGLARPSLETLTAIAGALGTSVAALTSREPRQNVSFTTQEGARAVQIDRPDVWPTLVRQKIEEAELLHAVELTFEGGANFCETLVYPGEKFIYVITGLFEVAIDGNEYVLEPGDAVTFDADTPHAYRCRTAGRILVVASGNEQIPTLDITERLSPPTAVQDLGR